jgi:hypothetical protein
MPTIIKEGGFSIRIYTNDHRPAHVHIVKAGAFAKVKLAPVEVVTNVGFNSRELNRVVELVEKYRDTLLEAWDRYYPER